MKDRQEGNAGDRVLRSSFFDENKVGVGVYFNRRYLVVELKKLSLLFEQQPQRDQGVLRILIETLLKEGIGYGYDLGDWLKKLKK